MPDTVTLDLPGLAEKARQIRLDILDSTTRAVLPALCPSCGADICSILTACPIRFPCDSLTWRHLNKVHVFNCAYVKRIGMKARLCYNRVGIEGEEHRAFHF